jgi:anaerobic glycerol-3-phosphate dehydrogenase
MSSSLLVTNKDVTKLRVFGQDLVKGQDRAAWKTEDYVDAFPQ